MWVEALESNIVYMANGLLENYTNISLGMCGEVNCCAVIVLQYNHLQCILMLMYIV